MPLTRIDSAFLDLDDFGGINFDVQSGVPTFSVDATNHRVGIGLNSPTQKLHVVGNFNLEGKIIAGDELGNSNISNALDLTSTTGVDAFRPINLIDSSGLIKIARVHNSFGGGLDIVQWDSTISNILSRSLIVAEGGRLKLLNETEGGDIVFEAKPTGGSSTEHLRITSDGKVGIGTGSPAKVLDVLTPAGGRIQFDKAGIDGSRILFLEADGTARATINNFGGSNETLQLNAPSKIDLAINGAEKVRLDANGRLLIGTLSSSGDHILQVNSGTDNEGIKVISTDAGSYIRFADNSTTAQIRLGAVGNDFKIDVNSAERLRIDSNGRIGIGTAASLQARFTVYSAANSTSTREIRIDASDAPSGGVGVGMFKILGDGNALGKYIIGYNSTHPSQANDVSLKNSDGDISFHTAVNNTPAEKVRITTTGRVGINEPNPAYTLDLGESPSTIRLVSENNGTALRVGAGGGSNDVTLIRVDGDANTHDGESDSAQYGFSLKYLGSGSQNANAFAIFSDNQQATQIQAFTILQDGTVGINSQTNIGGSAGSVGSKFNIFNGSDTENIFGITGADESSEYAGIGVSGGNAIITGGGAGTTSTGIVFRTAASGTETERLRITSAGLVGIGTDNPTERLTVHGTNNDTTPILGLRSGNNSDHINNGAQIAFGYNGTNHYQHFIHTRHNNSSNNNAIDFYVCDGTQQNTVTSGSVHTLSMVSGKVGIGTDNPTDLLDVHKSSSIAYDETDDDAQRTDSASIAIRNDNGSTNTFSQLVFDTGSTGQSIARIVALRTGSASNALTFVTEHNDTKAEKLRITSDGKVGIGTASAEYKVAVFNNGYTGVTIQSSRTTATDNIGGIHFKTQNTNVAYIQSLVNGTIRFRNTSSLTERLRITSTGNVGIGIVDPECKLQVNGDLQVGDSNNPGTFINVVGAGANQSFGIRFGSGSNNPESKFSILGNTSDGDMRFRFGGTERLRITSSGRIGIGTNNPSTMAHMYGSSGLYTRFERVDGKIVNFGNSNGDGIIDVSAANPLRVLVNGGERFRITSDGRFGFGTGANIDERGHIETASGNCRLKLQTGNTAVAGFVLQTSAKRFDIQAQDNFFQIYDNTVNEERLRITSGGNVGINNTTPDTILDVNSDGTAGIIRVTGARPSDSNNAFFAGRCSRGTIASPTTLVTNDIIATFSGQAHDGSNYLSAGRVRFGVDSISTGNLNSNLQFIVSNNGEYEAMRITSAGKVGIGTNNPDKKLVVRGANGEIAIDDTNGSPVLRLRNNGTTGGTAELTSGNSLLFRSGGTTERLRITSSGNVGIGTDNPSTKLHVLGQGIISTDSATQSNNFATLLLGERAAGDSIASLEFRYNANDFSSKIDGRNKQWAVWADWNSSSHDRINVNGQTATENITLRPGGTVDVVKAEYNTSTGASATYFAGTAHFQRVDTANEGGEIRFSRSVDNANHYAIDVNGNTTTNPRLRILNVTASREDFTLTHGGNIGIGTATPNYKFHVEGRALFTTGLQASTISESSLNSRTNIHSGFYQADATTTANGWPFTGWAHLTSNTHSNTSNYYAQQFASSFFNQELYFRNTQSGSTTTSQSWGQVMHTNSTLKPVFATSSGSTDAYSRYWYPGGEYYTTVHGITSPGAMNDMIEQGYYHVAYNATSNPTNAYGYLNVHRHMGSQYSLQHFIVSSDTSRQWMRASYPDSGQSSGRNWYQWYSYGALERENTFTNRQHLIGPSSTSTFTGLVANTSANRAQFVLHSDYSDLVISSAQNNNNHGSTLSFVTSNPSNAADYNKFVINKGNYGTRNQFLEFGFQNIVAANPHDYVNSSYTVLTLDGANKRVGIGAAARTPSYPLHIEFAGDSGIYSASSTSHSSLYLNCAAGSGTYIRMMAGGANKFWINTDGSGHLNFRPNGGGTTVRMQNGGKLDAFQGIYVASSAILANIELDFTTANNKYVDFYTNNGNTVNFRMPTNANVFHTGIQMTRNSAVSLYHANSVKLYTTSTGVYVNGSYQPTSDVNLKENIITVPNALDKIKAMRGVKFNWKKDGRPDYGVIAQEAEAVVPELVADHEVKTLTQAGALKKRPDDSDYVTTTQKGFCYDSMVGILIEAIKEQQATIDSLTARIDALENP